MRETEVSDGYSVCVISILQLIGGMVLTNRCIAEIRTGEGKTLTATLPCYLMALEGKDCTRCDSK